MEVKISCQKLPSTAERVVARRSYKPFEIIRTDHTYLLLVACSLSRANPLRCYQIKQLKSLLMP